MATEPDQDSPYQVSEDIRTAVPMGTAAIRYLAIFFGLLMLMPFATFSYQFGWENPNSGKRYRDSEFARINLIGLVIQSIATGAVAYSLSRHADKTSRFYDADKESVEAFSQSHQAVWFHIAVAISAVVSYRILTVIYIWFSESQTRYSP